MRIIPWYNIVVAFLLLLELLFIGMIAIVTPTAWTWPWVHELIWIICRVPPFTLIPVWIVLFAVDRMFAGPARRKGWIIARIIP